MLGNVRPELGKLSQEAQQRYAAYYCGLCDAIGRQSGVLSRMTLNYDMVFIALVRDDINKADYLVKHKGCVANPFKKKDILQSTPGTALAADVLAMVAYYKIVDDIQDEKWHKKIACMLALPYLYIKYRRASKRRSELAQVITQQCTAQPQAEKDSPTIDKVAMPTAKMCRAIFRRRAPENYDRVNELGQFGFFLGRVIYLLDGLKDIKEDALQHKFNIFNQLGYTAEEAASECYMALGEMAYWYNENEFSANKEILDNIIYLGLGRDIHFSAEEREENGTLLQGTGADIISK